MNEVNHTCNTSLHVPCFTDLPPSGNVSGGESEVFSSRFFSANLLTDLFSRQLLLVIICDMGVLKTVTQSSGRKYFQCTLKVLPDLL